MGTEISVNEDFFGIAHKLKQLDLSPGDRSRLLIKMASYSDNKDSDPQHLVMDVFKLFIVLSHRYASKHLRSCSIKALTDYKHAIAMVANETARMKAPLDKCLVFAMGLHPRLGDKSHVRHLDPELLRIVADLGGLRKCDYLH
ncbi:hypothetical protein T484DRAFT_1753859 [Baffinella frigidus]|nr:hypothetical protein T484DRAFT_1753859 [Cryptophyta sp. CCMP2293]